jgi:hypothetical protein
MPQQTSKMQKAMSCEAWWLVTMGTASDAAETTNTQRAKDSTGRAAIAVSNSLEPIMQHTMKAAKMTPCGSGGVSSTASGGSGVTSALSTS